MCRYVCIYIYVFICVYVCVYAFIYIHVNLWKIAICMYIYIFIECTYIYVYIFIHIYTFFEIWVKNSVHAQVLWPKKVSHGKSQFSEWWWQTVRVHVRMCFSPSHYHSLRVRTSIIKCICLHFVKSDSISLSRSLPLSFSSLTSLSLSPSISLFPS